MMKIPLDAEIPDDKLTRYLLVPRPWDDKSKFLAQGGFDLTNPGLLQQAVRNHAVQHEAAADGDNEYGEFFRVEGGLAGPNGVVLQIVSIWIQWNNDGSYHFVTLKPLK